MPGEEYGSLQDGAGENVPLSALDGAGENVPLSALDGALERAAGENDPFITSLRGEAPLKLLALDGGGIRGLSELLMIKEIMYKLHLKDGGNADGSLPKPCDYFDLIGGTDAGGIIALMLGRLRMDVDTAIRHYRELAKLVFSDANTCRFWGKKGFNTRNSEEAIKSLVQTVTADSESPLEDDQAGCQTFVCATEMKENALVIFGTHNLQLNCKVWEAARATSAAPTLFKPIEIAGQTFIGGELVHHNPSPVVLNQVRILFGDDRRIGCLVSLGTGQVLAEASTQNALQTHDKMFQFFVNCPNTYFRLDGGVQETKCSEWQKFAQVEADTMAYMRKNDTSQQLSLLVDTISVPTSAASLEQLNIETLHSTLIS